MQWGGKAAANVTPAHAGVQDLAATHVDPSLRSG
jgi:hypothetical protein